MTQSDYLTNHILVAPPSLDDPEYFQTVVLICQHTEEGAMGIVINRPTEVSLLELFRFLEVGDEAELDHELFEPLEMASVYLGGTDQLERGFVLHSPVRPEQQWESTAEVSADISITSSLDILQSIIRGQGPDRWFVALGYMLWGPGELEDELIENVWLTGPMTPDLLFVVEDTDRWKAAAASLGIDFLYLQEEMGHA